MVRKRVAAAAIALAMNGMAAAEGPYVGAKIAAMPADGVAGVSFDAAVNGGIMIGYEFMEEYGLGAEAEFTTSISDGDWSYLGASGNWDVDTKAFYLVSRLGGDLYFKLRAGWLRADGTIKGAGVEFSGDDSGFSGGFGGGYLVTDHIAAEVEWTKVDSDIDAWSVGLAYAF